MSDTIQPMNVSERVLIELKYTGKEVEQGTMSVEDVVPALQGFASAYGKIAALSSQEMTHSLRVVGVEKGSFHIVLDVVSKVASNPDQLAMAANASTVIGFGSGGAAAVVKAMMWVIKVTKHVQKEPYSETINAKDRSIVISNSKNVQLEIPINIYQIFKERTIEQDLSKIVQPLEAGKIDTTEIVVKADSAEIAKEEIAAEEKRFFEVEEIIVTETKEMWLTGILNSLTKTTNRGFFLLSDGTRISYRLASGKPEELYPYFIHKGLVKVRCKAHLDENLKPTQIDIYEIQPVQGKLEFPESLDDFLKDSGKEDNQNV